MNKVKTDNCWLPWVDTLPPKPEVSSNRNILIVIPSAGQNISRLDSCITSVEYSSQDINFRIVVVLCPNSREKIVELKKYFGTRAEIHGLNGKFNYCRSINYGVSKAGPNDRYVLFLNDDVVFTKPKDIDLLVDTLKRNKWACVGPYILYNPDVHDDTWPTNKSNARIKRQAEEIRTDSPVSGSCALWDKEWLDRIGPMDEEFGIGWGMDEADMCLRALRLGGRYGRQDSVAIKHIMHASFGAEYTKYAGAPHARSLNYFHKKYGNEVEQWGRSHHWFPLPGILVTLISDDDTDIIIKTIDQIDVCMKGLRWILAIGTTNSVKTELLQKRIENSSADWATLISLGSSNNKLAAHIETTVNSAKKLHAQYPAVYLVTSPTQLQSDAVSTRLWQARDNGNLSVSEKHGGILFHISYLPRIDLALKTSRR